MQRNSTVYLYEMAWILPSIAIAVGRLVALIVSAFGAGIYLPRNEGRPGVVSLLHRGGKNRWLFRALR